LLPLLLAGCLENDDTRAVALDDGGPNQAYPANYRVETLAFMKTYLNNPTGVREAVMAEPVLRTVGGRLRYVTCLRYAPRGSDGSYGDPRDRAVIYVNGRLDRILENPSDLCVGAVYAPFPELEKLTR
jgi:hypothetical protein